MLDGKVVLVTGGARGIGASICRTLAREGATVGINYSGSKEKAEALAAEIGGKAYRADVRDADAVTTMVSTVVAELGHVDGVVNNAISGKQEGSFAEASWEDYANSFDFGCKHVVNVVRAARPHFVANGGGRVINIVSELWNMAPAEWSVYMAGKGAMVGLSRSLACELGPENITVNMVAPGWMVTEKVDPASAGSKAFAASLPLKVHGSADEIGNACVFFMSHLSAYVTGAYLPVTGGRVTQMGN
ncbi:MAG: SDR family NAD(P)-dependent oxidoreductase [Fimbriimonadaceae bacterium]